MEGWLIGRRHPPFSGTKSKRLPKQRCRAASERQAIHPSRDQSRWAGSSTTAETPRVRSSRAQLARAARSTTSQHPNREAWRTSLASQAAREESGTRFFGEPTRSSQSHTPVPGALSATPTFLVSQCAESVVDGALDELMASHEEFSAGHNVEENASVVIAIGEGHTCGRNQAVRPRRNVFLFPAFVWWRDRALNPLWV